MKKFRVGLSVILFILVLAYAFAFSAHNSLSVELNFLTGMTFSLPVSIWLGSVLLFGVLIGLLSNIFAAARKRLIIRQLRKELAETRQRLSKLP